MISQIYNYIYPEDIKLKETNLDKLPELYYIPDNYYVESDNDYVFIFNFDILVIEKNKIIELCKLFEDLKNRIKNIGSSRITKDLIEYINNLNCNKIFSPEELFRLLILYSDWVHTNSVNTKIIRQPSLQDGFKGCLFLFYSLDNTTLINSDNFNTKYANSLMNIITYANIITRYNAESMIPEINDIINSLSIIN
jgi:hypothetical protein